MSSFVSAVKANQVIGQTYNGAETLVTTGNACLDFFVAAGNRDVVLNKEFDLAFSKDPKVAFRIALWIRDIRGGAGERQTFRNLLKHFEHHYTDQLMLMLPRIPDLGRWDDLLIFEEKAVKDAAYSLIKSALEAKNGLCAKWMPRKGKIACELREFLGLTPKAYRKTLVNLTKVVESQMCARQWKEIVFDHVPSVAAARYQKAFKRHAPEEYKAYRDGLVKAKEDGTTERKINAGAVYPYDIIKSINYGNRDVSKAQWNALPNWLGDNHILPMIDVSGSMYSWNYYGQRNVIKSNITPMDIATSIGLYIADKQTGAFNGMFMTFSSSPELQVLTGDIIDKNNQMRCSNWGMSTNIEAGFEKILQLAKQNNVPNDEMPKMLLIVSDMEFDSCVEGTNYENARRMFEAAGYELPKVVFWAVNGRVNNNPVREHDVNTAIVSGFSPSIFRAIISGDLKKFTPESIMFETVMSPRYDIEGLTV